MCSRQHGLSSWLSHLSEQGENHLIVINGKIHVEGSLLVKEAICGYHRDDIHQKVVKVAVPRMHKHADVLLLVVYCLDHKSLAEHDYVHCGLYCESFTPECDEEIFAKVIAQV